MLTGPVCSLEDHALWDRGEGAERRPRVDDQLLIWEGLAPIPNPGVTQMNTGVLQESQEIQPWQNLVCLSQGHNRIDWWETEVAFRFQDVQDLLDNVCHHPHALGIDIAINAPLIPGLLLLTRPLKVSVEVGHLITRLLAKWQLGALALPLRFQSLRSEEHPASEGRDGDSYGSLNAHFAVDGIKKDFGQIWVKGKQSHLSPESGEPTSLDSSKELEILNSVIQRFPPGRLHILKSVNVLDPKFKQLDHGER